MKSNILFNFFSASAIYGRTIFAISQKANEHQILKLERNAIARLFISTNVYIIEGKETPTMCASFASAALPYRSPHPIAEPQPSSIASFVRSFVE